MGAAYGPCAENSMNAPVSATKQGGRGRCGVAPGAGGDYLRSGCKMEAAPMSFRLSLLLLAVLGCAASGCTADPSDETPASAATVVSLTRGDDGVWTASYRFSEPQTALIFSRSALGRMSEKPWRPESWRIVTPDVSLVREGDADLLVAAEGAAFERVDIEITPYTQPLIADYTPFMQFSDGGIAAFTGQFELGPADMAALARGEEGLDEVLDLQFDFAGLPADSIVLNGETYAARASYDGAAETYVYFGDTRPVETEHLTLLLDTEIPEWILGELRGFLPVLMDYFSEGMNVAPPARPTVYAVWGGDGHDGYSQNGSVLPGFLVANFSGKGLLTPDDAALGRLRRFYAHEAAHFWNGWSVEPAEQKQAWVHEGAADQLAIYAMSALVDGYDREAALLGQLSACEKSGAGAALNEAAAEGRFGDVYSCGSLVHFLAEAALARTGKSPFDLWAELIRRSKADDGTYDMTLWLSVLEELTGDAELTALARRYAEDGLSAEEFEARIAVPVRAMAAR